MRCSDTDGRTAGCVTARTNRPRITADNAADIMHLGVRAVDNGSVIRTARNRRVGAVESHDSADIQITAIHIAAITAVSRKDIQDNGIVGAVRNRTVIPAGDTRQRIMIGIGGMRHHRSRIIMVRTIVQRNGDTGRVIGNRTTVHRTEIETDDTA